MDPKELKALLKEAKDGLKSKEFLTTAKNCKLILKKEPQHYQANLYLGTAMKEQGKWQQAIECYKKATEIDPNQVYAWQGIILTYEKQGIKVHNDLLDAYKRVATFFEKDDKAKYIESTKKLANVLISQEDTKGALKVIMRLAKSYPVDLEVAGMIVGLLVKTVYDTRTPEQNTLYTSALETLVTDSPQPTEEICKKYFTQLNRMGEYETVFRQAVSMRPRWNFYSSPMEWLCRYYLEGRLNPKQLLEIGTFDGITDKLFKLYPSSTFGHFARGKFIIDSGLNMPDGFMFIRTGLESSPNNFDAWLTLIKGRIKFGDFEGAAEDCATALRHFADAKKWSTLRELNAQALSWFDEDKAIQLIVTLREGGTFEENWKLQWAEARIAARKAEFEKLKGLVAVLDDEKPGFWFPIFYKTVLGVDLTSKTDLKSAIDSHLALTHATEGDNEEAFCLQLEAAILLFNLKYYEEAADILVNLTKTEIGRSRPIPLKYLGDFYTLQENIELASKCYRKSYKLCPSGEVGAQLSDAYFTLGLEDKNRELLIEATKLFTKLKSKWAWLRLGILYLHDGKANEAVTAFQAAIRADINDCHVWESLADAYFMRGSYSAALNTFNKALTLGADPMYPKLKIGVIYQCLGQHDESIATLESMLVEYPENCTPVLVELARTHCLIAQDMCAENYDERAQKAVENSLAYSVLAIMHSPKRILLPWKLIGESPLIFSGVSEVTEVKIKVPKFFLGENTANKDLKKLKSTKDLEYEHISLDKFREIGIQALLECLRVLDSPEENLGYSKGMRSYIYHQLALLYFNRARAISQNIAEEVNAKKSSEFLKKALVCVKKAIASNQQQYLYWNTLGVIAYFTENDELSQHAFIKSLNLETNNVVAWCNLGMLYLKHDKEMLAYQAFHKAQAVSPLYSYSWIGQGLVAEKLQPKEAPDLFRHAAHLEPTPFGVSCFSDWVCRLMLRDVEFSEHDYWFTIVRVDALTIVNDLITRVDERCKTPQLYNMKGISAALNGFHNTALESFTRALELTKFSTPETAALTEEDRKKILLNRITMLVKLQKYEEAVEAFSSLENLDTIGFTVGALTMGKLGYLEQAEKLYLQLLECIPAENESDKMNATIALGLIYNELNGPDAACKLLLQNWMVKSPHALLALSAIGVMNSDSNFVKNVMKYLEKHRDNDDVLADIGFIKACFHIMNGDSRAGVNSLLKLVHVHPQNARLWSILSQIIFRHEFDSIHSSTFRKITMTALKLSTQRQKRQSPDSSPSNKSSSTTLSNSAVISLCYLMDGDWRTAIRMALQGIKNYPEERENFIVLASAFWYQYSETRDPNLYHRVVKLLLKEVELDRIPLRAKEWVSTFLTLVVNYKV